MKSCHFKQESSRTAVGYVPLKPKDYNQKELLDATEMMLARAQEIAANDLSLWPEKIHVVVSNKVRNCCSNLSRIHWWPFKFVPKPLYQCLIIVIFDDQTDAHVPVFLCFINFQNPTNIYTSSLMGQNYCWPKNSSINVYMCFLKLPYKRITWKGISSYKQWFGKVQSYPEFKILPQNNPCSHLLKFKITSINVTLFLLRVKNRNVWIY